MDFIKQVTDAELVVDTRPRVFLQWRNTEKSRDVNDCYERIVMGETVIYINNHNRNSSVVCGNPFWDKLESIYNAVLAKKESWICYMILTKLNDTK